MRWWMFTDSFIMYVNPIIVLYTLNLYSALNPLCLKKTERKKSRVEATKEWTDKLKDICEASILWSVFDGQNGSEVKKN